MKVVLLLASAAALSMAQQPPSQNITDGKGNILQESQNPILRPPGPLVIGYDFELLKIDLGPIAAGNPKPWSFILDESAKWTFHIGGKDYVIDGATIARVVQESARTSQPPKDIPECVGKSHFYEGEVCRNEKGQIWRYHENNWILSIGGSR